MKPGYLNLHGYVKSRTDWLLRELPVQKRRCSSLVRRARNVLDRWGLEQLVYGEETISEGEETSRVHGVLAGKRIAVLVARGFDQVELTESVQALERAGADTEIVSPGGGKVRGWNDGTWATTVFRIDVPLSNADPESYDGLLLPGGAMSPDTLRRNPQALRFVRSFFDARKPVAAICHGPWPLLSAGLLNGRTLTSYVPLQRDFENAGARWVDREVVVDDGLVTSRTPDDIPAFNRKMIEEFARDRRETRGAGV
jgi:protease I